MSEYTELAQKFQDLSIEAQLDSAARSLELAIQKAADIAIPKRKISYHSKPWWNDEIDKSRKRLSQKRRAWKRVRDMYVILFSVRSAPFKGHADVPILL